MPAVAYEGRIPASTDAEIVPPSPGAGCARSTRSCSPFPTGFTVHPKLAKQLERRRAGARRGRDRLGPGRGARLREPARRGHPGPPDRPGHRARHVLSPPPRPPRRARTGSPTRRSRTCGRRPRRSRCTTRRSPRRPASASSTATRSPRPRRSSSGRPSSATSSTARRSRSTSSSSSGLSKWGQTSRLTLLLPARLRGQRPGALERAARAVPPASGAGEHPHRELHDRRAVLPPAAPAGARPERAAADRDDAEGPAAAEGGVVDAGAT